jgi:hypothetical protein
MESDFSTAVAAWSDFYAAVAGASGTLVGLLFVSLALNPTIMRDDRLAGLRVWAGQTFHRFLMVLVVALVALIPGETPEGIAWLLAIVGVIGILNVALAARRARTDPDPAWRSRHALMRFFSPALAYVCSLWAADEAWRGDPDALS